MKSLVTGASGLVGCRLVEMLAEKYGEASVVAAVGPDPSPAEEARIASLRQLGVAILPIDVLNKDVFEGPVPQFSTLFHLAAYVTTERNSDDVHVNDVGTSNLLARLRPALKGTRVVFTSTLAAAEAPVAVRGGLAAPLRSETPCLPRIPYGRTKLRAEEIVREQGTQSEYSHTILRLCTVYGPGYREGGMFEVLPKVLRKQSLAGRVAWPGKMSLIFLDDLVRLIMAVAREQQAEDRTFLVSSGEDPSFADIAAQVAHVHGFDHRPIAVPSVAEDLARKVTGAWPVWQRAPYSVMIAAWRASLLLEGLFCDGSELTRLLNMQYVPWREGFERMYQQS